MTSSQPALHDEGTVTFLSRHAMLFTRDERGSFKGALSRVLTDFRSAKIYTCGIGNLKIMGHFFISTETVNDHLWLQMAWMELDCNLKN